MPAETLQKNPFVTMTLGPWSSHPDMMAKQKRRLLWLGMTPFLLGILLVVLVLTSYKPADFAAVRDWAGFIAVCGSLWGKIKFSLAVLALAGCVSAGFALTLNVLWLVGMTLARGGAGEIAERDRVPFPAWVVVCFCLFWLVPPALWACRDFFTALDWRLNLLLQLSANLLCLLPVAALLAWTRWAGRKPGPGEELHHPVGHLLAALLFLGLAVAVWLVPRPALFDQLMDEWFGWLAQCGLDTPRVYGWVRTALGTVLSLWGVFHLLLWRLKVEIRPKKKRKARKGEDEADAEYEDVDDGGIPAGARHLLANLPSGVTAEPGPGGESVYRRTVGETSPVASPVKHGLEYLMGGDKKPTRDQQEFFNRFVEAFGAARRGFGQDAAGQQEPSDRPDLLLVGQDGTGRTEILLAAALYAAVVRGQRVLFLCAEPEACSGLAGRASLRLRRMGVDAYVSAARLDPLDVAAWLDPEGESSPPNLLFATPDMAERGFFLNPATRRPDKAETMRKLLVGFGAVIIDDFLDMPLAFRAHTAFLLDKLKLLHAAEPTLAQYAVATGPLHKAEDLGARLFGKAGFDRKRNVFELKPRECAPYWFGTLRVDGGGAVGEGGLSLEKAMQELVRVSAAGGFRTLLYQKGMSRNRKEALKNELSAEAAEGVVDVASRFRELAELDATPDNVFYLSLASGDAGMALRLNLDGGDPVFFRILQNGGREEVPPEEFGLIPDETALPLRIHHLRSVLQFVRTHIPVPAAAWECFKISLTHPCARELVPGSKPGTVSVEWLHDEIKDAVYGAGMLWPYLSLETAVAFGSAGKGDFNSLPTDRGEIWKSAAGGGRLLLAEDEKALGSVRPGHLAVWRDQRNGSEIGESDLSHSDMLVYAGQDEYTVADVVSPGSEDASRYAIQFQARYRQGGDTEFVFPVRRLAWRVPRGELRVPSVNVLAEMAQFRVEREGAPTCRVEGALCGLLNWRGEPKECGSHSYSHEAYLSCMVLLPTLETGEKSGKAEELLQNCLDGTWRTDAAGGYSCALTHALGAALRGKMADWPFYAVAPAFWTEGREDSVGCVTVWIVEPANSGRTVHPVLQQLMENDRDFRLALYKEARTTLEECQTLEELRMASRLAFAGEALEEDDRRKAIGVLDTLLDRERASEWMARRLRERGEERARRKEKARKNRHPRIVEPTPEEREFDTVVTCALKEFRDTIDVSKFAVEYGWDCDRLADLFNDVQWNHPEIFWVSKSWRYQWWHESDGTITRFVFTDLDYAFDPGELSKKCEEFDGAVAEALASVKGARDDAETALRLHDFIVRTCEYDTAAAKRKDSSPLARTAYSVLVRHLAVCEGYSMAYRLLLKRVGIESEEVLSDAMNHCWNYVRLGDSWYHVDVTWDDPVFSGPRPSDDTVSRDNFLMSDVRARETKHHGWNVRGLPAAADTAFDRRVWA